MKLPFEFVPKLSPHGILLPPAALHMPCPSCGRSNRLAFPHARTQQGVAEVYGDEAILEFPDRPEYALVYAFVAVHPFMVAEVEEKIVEVKRRLLPRRDPSEWTFHVTELRSTGARAKLGIDLPIHQIDAAIRDLAAPLAAREDERLIAAMLYPPFDVGKVVTSGRRKDEQALKNSLRDRTLAAGITAVTELLTRQEWGLNITLEAQSLAHENNQSDYIVERVARGLRYDLNFIYSCRGLHVGLPETVPKAPIIGLELADLAAYVVRRSLRDAITGQATELPLSMLGRVFWGMFNGTGFGTHTAVGLPWHHFFPTES